MILLFMMRFYRMSHPVVFMIYDNAYGLKSKMAMTDILLINDR